MLYKTAIKSVANKTPLFISLIDLTSGPYATRTGHPQSKETPLGATWDHPPWGLGVMRGSAAHFYFYH